MNAPGPQYINLYRKPIGWVSRVLKANSVALALLTMLLGLGALATYGNWRATRLENMANAISSELGQRNVGLAQASAKYQTRQDYRQLTARVERLRRLIARQQVVLGQTDSLAAAQRAGFSKSLTAISRANVPGVWLTRVELVVNPAKIQLSGVSMSPDLMPSYLTALGAQPGLGIKRLRSFTLQGGVGDQRAAAVGAVAFNLLQSSGDTAEPP